MKTPTARLLRIALTALLLQGLFPATNAELTCPPGMDEVCFGADNFDETVAQNCIISYNDIMWKAMKYCSEDYSVRTVKVVHIEDMVESNAQKRLLGRSFSRIRQRRLGGCRRCKCDNRDPNCARRRLLSKPSTEKVIDNASDLAPKLLRRQLDDYRDENTLSITSTGVSKVEDVICPENSVSKEYDEDGFDNLGIACCIAGVLESYISSQWSCKTEPPTQLKENNPWFGKCSI